MAPTFETWAEMTARHKRERLEMVQSLAQSSYTQTQASKILDVKLTCLNNYVQRNRVFWPVIQQGKTRND
jgi:hypothetical protein